MSENKTQSPPPELDRPDDQLSIRKQNNDFSPPPLEYFVCECGKKYLSYSALYVHARIKHNVKLTSSSKSDGWKISAQSKGVVEKTFSLKSGTANKFEELSIPEEVVQKDQAAQEERLLRLRNQLILTQIFFQYQSECQLSDEELTLFKKFRETIQKKNHKKSAFKIQEIPYFFNQFTNILAQGSTVRSRKWRRSCKYLQTFYEWMFKNSYTQLIVTCELD